jgi:lysophospholipase L1-like esterase
MSSLPSSLTVAVFLALSFLPIDLRAQTPAPSEEVAASELAIPVIERNAQGEVTIQCATPDALVLYTLDGLDPGSKTGPYLAPILLPAGGVVKARAFSADRKKRSTLAELKVEPVAGTPAQPSTLVPCTQDRDWPSYDWAKRHAIVSQIGRDRSPTLVFIGDSITQMFGGEPLDRPQVGQEVWNKYYGKRNVLNLGFGWDYVENCLWRLQHGELDEAKAKAVVIHIGTNNTGKNSAEEIVTGIKAICAEVRKRQPDAKIILMAVFPRGAKPDEKRAKIDTINHGLADFVAKAGDIQLLDIGPKFLGPDGSISREVMGDFLHPTAKGYEIWASELEPILSKLLGS